MLILIYVYYNKSNSVRMYIRKSVRPSYMVTNKIMYASNSQNKQIEKLLYRLKFILSTHQLTPSLVIKFICTFHNHPLSIQYGVGG